MPELLNSVFSAGATGVTSTYLKVTKQKQQDHNTDITETQGFSTRPLQDQVKIRITLPLSAHIQFKSSPSSAQVSIGSCNKVYS